MNTFANVALASAVALSFSAAAVAQDAADGHAQHARPPKMTGASMVSARLADNGTLHLVYVSDDGASKRVGYLQFFGSAPYKSWISADEALSHWPESPPQIELTDDGVLHVLYTVRQGPIAAGAVELRYTTSSDSGATWSPFRAIGDPAQPVYRSCAAMQAMPGGALALSWLEARDAGGAVGVNTGFMRAGVLDSRSFDDKACECCATELLMLPGGDIWLAYRDVDPMSVRDLYVTRMPADADRFGPPQRISRDRWAIPGCPDTGPRLTLGGDRVWAGWFSGNPPGIYAASAAPGDPQFAPRETIQLKDDRVTALAHPAVGTLPDGRVLVAYECTRDGERRIEGRIRKTDEWSDPIRLAGTGEYPLVVANDSVAYLVYTAIEGQTKDIRVTPLNVQLNPVRN